jgi:hypothetical protein
MTASTLGAPLRSPQLGPHLEQLRAEHRIGRDPAKERWRPRSRTHPLLRRNGGDRRGRKPFAELFILDERIDVLGD